MFKALAPVCENSVNLFVTKNLLILLFVFYSFHLLSQPGPYGGSLEFRITLNGRYLLKNNKNLQVFPEYIKEKNSSSFSKEVVWINDSTLSYSSMETPVGGVMPEDLTIVVTYKKVTMKIKGIGIDELSIDAIPFLKGTYQVPEEYIHYLNVKTGPQSNPIVDWHSFNVEHKVKIPYAILEKVNTNHSATTSPKDIQKHYKVANHSNWRKGSAILQLNKENDKWDTLFDNIYAHQIHLASNDEVTVFTISDYTLLVQSGKAGKWELIFIKETVEDNDLGRIYPVHIDSMWLAGNKILLKGSRYFTFHSEGFHLADTTYEVHLNLDKDSELYKTIKNECENEITGYKKDFITKFIDNHLSFAIRHKNSNYLSRLPNYLKEGRFYQPMGGNTDHLLLELSNGRFSYTGTRHLTAMDNYAFYDSQGTYSFNDSTITFVENSKYSNASFDWFNISFVPRGTYYWWFYKNVLILIQYEVEKME